MAAFAVSGSFVFGDHLSFTAGNDPNGILALITGKLCAGLYAAIIAMTITKNTHAK